MLPALRSRVWPPALLGSLALVGPGNTSLTCPRWSCPRRFWKGIWGPPCLARSRCPALTSSRDEWGPGPHRPRLSRWDPFLALVVSETKPAVIFILKRVHFLRVLPILECVITLYPSSPELNFLS